MPTEPKGPVPPIIGTVFIIRIGKSVLAFLIGVLFRQPVGTALTISASLAQIGEGVLHARRNFGIRVTVD